MESNHFRGRYSYPCDKCELVLTTRISIHRHRQSIHKLGKEMKILYCKLCDYKTKGRADLKKHKLSSHESLRYSCDQCEHQTTSQTNLRTHKKTNHMGIIYCCKHCDYQTKWQARLKIHEQVKHTTPKNQAAVSHPNHHIPKGRNLPFHLREKWII